MTETEETPKIEDAIPLVVDPETEREMAILMRASLLSMAEATLAIRAGILAMVAGLERRYGIERKK